MFVLYLISSAERDYCLHLAASEYVRKQTQLRVFDVFITVQWKFVDSLPAA